MTRQARQVILLLWVVVLQVHTSFSQSHASRNNYTGSWETPSSWDPTWTAPETNINGFDITINGYITADTSLSFSGVASTLTINDTLVIKGNLTLDNNNDLLVNNNGILIVRGNLTINNQTIIIANGYLIVTGNVIKVSSVYQGSFTSNDNPVKVFIGGVITSLGLTTNNPDYPVLNCTAPPTTPYANSTYSFGNMTDIIDDPINSFFQATCAIVNVNSNGPLCAGNSLNLTSTGGIGYNWSGPNGFTSTAQNPSILNANTAMTGKYTVIVTAASGCTVQASTNVVVNALPVTPIITAGGPTTFCAGGSVTLTSSAASTYLWSTGETTQSINVTSTGNYTVHVTNVNGCQSAVSVPTIVTVNALPATPVITASGPVTFCAGEGVTLTSSAEASYLWSNGATTSSINVTAAGSYTVQLTNSNGCHSAVSQATTVNVNTLPVVFAGTDVTISYGTSTTIDASVTGTGPFAYSWSPSGKLVNASVEDPTTVNLLMTTVFTLTVTSTTTSCSGTDEVAVTISGGALGSTPVAAPGTVCAGEEVQLYALASGGSGSYTYSWTSTPAGFTSTIPDPKVNPAVNTTYHVAVFDGFTTVNSQVAVTVNAIPVTPGITANGPTTFCAGGNVTLTADAGSTYLWSTGETSRSINVTETGNYTVQITNVSGCLSAASIATVVTVNALPVTPTITAGGPTTFCAGGSVTLTSSAGSTYLWSTGETSPGINVTTAGSYTVRITNASGCQSAASVATIVTVNDLPAAPVITAFGPTTFCTGGSVTLTSSAGTTYLWSNGATSPSINVTTAGSYSVEVTDENGCQSAASAPTSVIINAVPAVSITSSNSSMCANDNRTLTGNPAGGTFTLVDGPATISGNVLTATGAGTIMVEYNYADVCANKASQFILVDEMPVAYAGPDQELRFVFETQMNAELSSSETGEWSLLSGSGLINDIHSPSTTVRGLSTGENRFAWIVRNGSCEASDEVIINVIDVFVPSVITPNGDGRNDYFKIGDILGQVQLIIFNRWGTEEYESDHYLNDWDGSNKKGVKLPADTYFYILKFENGIIKKGSVLIKR